jgi:hypothetical protein
VIPRRVSATSTPLFSPERMKILEKSITTGEKSKPHEEKTHHSELRFDRHGDSREFPYS